MRTRGELWRCWGGCEGEASLLFLISYIYLWHLWMCALGRRLGAYCTYHSYSGVYERLFDIPSIVQRRGARLSGGRVLFWFFQTSSEEKESGLGSRGDRGMAWHGD